MTNVAVGRIPWPRERVTDAYTRTNGATEGNIIATIITTHVMRKSPALIIATAPRSIDPCRTVISQAAAAHTKSAATMVALTGFGRGVTDAAREATTG
jgi:hypothetical protein